MQKGLFSLFSPIEGKVVKWSNDQKAMDPVYLTGKAGNI